jgi:chemotaxis methyl-accepting protein methylase
MKVLPSRSVEAKVRAEQGRTLLLEKLLAERGWDFRGYKRTSLTRRVLKRLQANGLYSVSEYLSLLDADPSEYRRLFSCLTIKVREFFREPEVFAALCEYIAPGSGSPVRAWCRPACGKRPTAGYFVSSECLL